MDWEIFSFTGVGPIKFGMSPEEVAALVGAPVRTRKGLRPGSLTELRQDDVPIVKYRDGKASEIECFYDVSTAFFGDILIFQERGRDVMRKLESLNGGALISVGIVLFQNLGITTGRLDELVREEHSVTAFQKGLWDQKLSEFKEISFL